MIAPRTQRLRDPVHGLIVFQNDQPVDQLAWALTGTPEFQRLRRIRQLGLASGFRFEYHHYGPYSRDLDLATADARALGVVQEDILHRADGLVHDGRTVPGVFISI